MLKAKPTNVVYKRVAENAEVGIFSLVEPLDYLLVEALHPVGTMFAGVYPKGHTVLELSKTMFEGQVPSTVLSPRMKMLEAQGLVEGVKGVGTGGARIWQSTEAGRKLVSDWRKKNKA